MKMGEEWRKWWHEKHGKNMPMGGYHPMEGVIYDAFKAGWEANNAHLSAVQSTTSGVQSTHGEGQHVPMEVRELL
jgi:hypothetical protein